jgi:hypothetical protein
MRLRFDKNLPDCVVANDIFFETKKFRILCAKLYKENDLYKLQYTDHFLLNWSHHSLCNDLPAKKETFVSETLFQTFRNYLTVCARFPVYKKNPLFSRTNNVFYQLPLLEEPYNRHFFFEPVYENSFEVGDIEKICTYFGLTNTDLANLIGCHHHSIKRAFNDPKAYIVLEKIHEFFSSKNIFEDKYKSNFRYIHSSKKEIILKKMDHFFAQKYIIWDKIYKDVDG